MSNYTKTTNFAAKDSLPSGNAGKIVKGTEIDAEFNNIATASATKADINDATLTGTTTFGSLNDGTITITGWVDEDNMSSNSAVLVPTQQSVKAYVDSTTTAQDLDVTDGSASIDIDLDSESLGILGGTGVTSTASGTGVTLAIDSTVATLTGSQTLTNKTLTTPTILTSFTIGSATISEAELEILDGATVTTAELNVLDGITSTTAELNILDGVTSTAAEINILDGVTSTTAELNKLDGFTGTVADLNYAKDLNATGVTASEFDILDGLTATTAELNILDGVTSTTAELNILDGVTATTAELNILDGVTSTAAELNILDGVTSTTAELNILDGVTSTATELNLLDGVTATTAELNYTDGVTSAIQTQLDSKISSADAALTGNATITTSDNTTQLALISTDADANAGPILDLFRNSVSAADNDLTGQVYFSGKNDADEKTYYGQITSQITDVSNGSEDFALELSTLTAGSSNSRLFISPTETVFNESSADLDFRIESDGNTNAFFLEGSSGNTGIGIAPTSYKLTVNSGATTETTAAAIGYNGDAGTNLYINTDHGNNLVSLYASGSASKAMRFLSGTLEVMRLDTLGNVGIGGIASNSSGYTTLNLNNATNGGLFTFQNNGTAKGYIYNSSSQFRIESATSTPLVFANASGETMRIDSSSNVVVGNTSLNAASSVGFTAAGQIRQVFASGVANDSLFGAISGVSNGFQITQDTSNNQKYIFHNGGTPSVTIDSAGSVGIGTSSPTQELEIKAASVPTLKLNQAGTYGAEIALRGNDLDIAGSANAIVFYTGGNNDVSTTERMRINSAGNVGINNPNPAQTLSICNPANPNRNGIEIAIGAGDTSSNTIQNYNRATGAYTPLNIASSILTFGVGTAATERMRITSAGKLVVNGTIAGYSGTDITIGSPSAGSSGLSILSTTTGYGYLLFGDTTGDATGGYSGQINYAHGTNRMGINTNGSERMAIDSSGNVMVGTQTQYFARLSVQGEANQNAVTVRVGTNGYPAINFQNTAGAQQGYITTNATSVQYVSISDQRAKENIADADDAGSKIDSIQVRKFDWIADGSHQDYGMIAQELQAVAPEAVSGDPDSENMMGVDYSKLVPMLVKEIQSLRTRVQELENN